MFIPDPGSGFFHHRSQIWNFPSRILVPDTQHWIDKELKYFETKKLGSKLSEIWCEMFITNFGSRILTTDYGYLTRTTLHLWFYRQKCPQATRNGVIWTSADPQYCHTGPYQHCGWKMIYSRSGLHISKQCGSAYRSDHKSGPLKKLLEMF